MFLGWITPLITNFWCLDTSSNTFIHDFYNIRDHRSNFQSVEHYLSSTKPHLLFLTETQLSVTIDSSPFSVLSYFLYPHVQPKAGCCAYVRNDITCYRAHKFGSSECSTIWLRLQCHSLSTYICAVYLSPNSSEYVKLLEYLTSKLKYILSHFSYAGISMLEDFNVHHQPTEQIFKFSILHDLEQ